MQIGNISRSVNTYKLPNAQKSPSFEARIHLCTQDEFYQHVKELKPEIVGGEKGNMEEAKTGIPSIYTEDARMCTIGSVINRKSRKAFLTHLIPDEKNISMLFQKKGQITIQNQIINCIEKLHQPSENTEEKLEGFITGAKFMPVPPENQVSEKIFDQSLILCNAVRKTFNKIAETKNLTYSIMTVQTKYQDNVSLIADSENGIFYLLIQDKDKNVKTSPKEIAEHFEIIKIAKNDTVTNLKDGHINNITKEVRRFEKDPGIEELKNLVNRR